MNTATPFPASESPSAADESPSTAPFDWLLVLGFPPDAARRSLGLPASTPSSFDDPLPPAAA